MIKFTRRGIFLVFVPTAIFLFFYGCASSPTGVYIPTKPDPTHTPEGFISTADFRETASAATLAAINKTTPVPRTAAPRIYKMLICQDCADTGTLINVWTHPDRSGIVTKVPHGTRVQVLNSTVYDGIEYYRIEVNGKTGYVRDWFIEGYNE